MYRILVINPGSTSTKASVYEDERCIANANVKVDIQEIKKADRIVDQLHMRTEHIRGFLKEQGLSVEDLDIIAARGGMLPPCQSGAFMVNQFMLDVLTYAPKTEHASNLACMIGMELSGGAIPVMVYDPPTVDELDPLARITGLPQIKVESVQHILNTKSVGRLTAAKLGIKYEEARFIIAHLGGGVSITAHKNGRIIDFLSASTGPMSPERSGALPNAQLIDLCFSGDYSEREIRKMMIGNGGFMAYLGTQDALEVENMALSGNELAASLYAAMSYQTAKAIGELYAALDCRVDAIIFTGALARSEYLINPVIERIGSLGRIEIIPGEREMEALAEGALRVLGGSEKAKEYTLIPEGFESREDFYAFAEKCKSY